MLLNQDQDLLADLSIAICSSCNLYKQDNEFAADMDGIDKIEEIKVRLTKV